MWVFFCRNQQIVSEVTNPVSHMSICRHLTCYLQASAGMAGFSYPMQYEQGFLWFHDFGDRGEKGIFLHLMPNLCLFLWPKQLISPGLKGAATSTCSMALDSACLSSFESMRRLERANTAAGVHKFSVLFCKPESALYLFLPGVPEFCTLIVSPTLLSSFLSKPLSLGG